MLSPIKRSLQLNALEIYGVAVQRRRFIRAGTLTFALQLVFYFYRHGRHMYNLGAQTWHNLGR